MKIIVEPNGIGKYIKNTDEIRKCNANLENGEVKWDIYTISMCK